MLGVLDSVARKLSRASYHSARAYHHLTLWRRNRRYSQAPLLVYQMGKVGSKSVAKSLHADALRRPIHHVHFLAEQRVKELERERRPLFRTPDEKKLKRIWEYQYLRRRLAKRKSTDRWKIVTLVRDPVARNLSTFFEEIRVVERHSDKVWKIHSDRYGFDATVDLDNPENLFELFWRHCQHNRPLEYFDTEFKPLFDIDVLASPFPMDRGFQIYPGRGVDILLIRLENLSSCASVAFKEFLDLNDFELSDTNLAKDKEYAQLYSQFKQAIPIPTSYLDKLYESRFSQHLYSAAEIAQFRQKWQRLAAPAVTASDLT